jgi:transposase
MPPLVNGILYVLTTGCQWRQLPKASPPKSTTHDYYVGLNCTGVLTQIHHALYAKVRELEGDTLGLLINLAVTPADVQDRNMIAPLLAIACKRFPSIEKAIADGGYQGKATADDVEDQAGISLEIVKRSDAIKGLVLLPKRWIVERTYGWLGR